jgi:hypothetical protein
MRVGAPQSRSRRCAEEKNLTPTGNRAPAVKLVARRYTDTLNIFSIYSPILLFHILCTVGWETMLQLCRGTRKGVEESCVPELTEKIHENSQSGILYILAEIRSRYLSNLKQMCDDRWNKISHEPRTSNSKTANPTHCFQLQCDSPNSTCNVRKSGPATGSDFSLHRTWRIEAGSSCMQNNLRR